MIIETNPSVVRAYSDAQRRAGKKIGFVPTMGYLHQGHMSLVEYAAHENDVVIVSIYVNPTQFAPTEDLAKYPRDFEKDKALCENAGVAMIFFPTNESMYPNGFNTYVVPEALSQNLCGKSRPIHFRGVCTVVTKLFNIVNPDAAYFGQKDYQQYKIIEQMVVDLNMTTRTVPCPIVRESDGLAMSSRNVYLSVDERRFALSISQALGMARDMLSAGERKASVILEVMHTHIEKTGIARVDYLQCVNETTLEDVENIDCVAKVVFACAVYFGKTRLIDNMVWSEHDM